MTDDRKPRVFLLAGDARDGWRAALETVGLEVRTPGWLDAVTAARLEPPDVVVVASDLPRNAPDILVRAFRGLGLKRIPLVVAGFGPEEFEECSMQPSFGIEAAPDRFLPSPVDARALAAAVRDLARAGGGPSRLTRGQWLALALCGLGFLPIAVAAVLGIGRDFVERPPARGNDWLEGVLLVAGFATVGIGALASRIADRRPLTARRRRSAVGWAAFLTFQVASLSGRSLPRAHFALFTLAFAGFAVWAWLGRDIRPRTGAGRVWLTILAAVLAALALATAVPLAVYAA